MIHPVRPIVLLVCSGLMIGGLVGLVGCKKETDPQAVPVPSGAVVAAPPSSAASEAAQIPSASAAPTPPPPPPPVVQQPPIDGCCSALSSAAAASKVPADKDKFQLASKICSGIAAKVKSGQAQRASALTTIRAQLSGVGTPSECR